MGFGPREITSWSLWEYAAAVDAYNHAYGGSSKPAPPSNEEFEAMKAAHGD